ncbi:hypothetical protein Tco_0481798 [Tanacetum coccineum]
MMWACPKKIIESVSCLVKSFIKSLLKSHDFISKICCFRRREEFVDEFRNKIIPCENRSRGFFFKPNPGGTLEGKWEKHKLYRRTRDVRELHRRSDLVEITDVSMRVFFVMSEELFVLNEGKQTIFKRKVCPRVSRTSQETQKVKPKLDVDLSGEPVDQSDYRSKIGSLMYLTSSRPDLVQAVCYCARYQARPTQKHLKEVKRIFKYLKGTINMGLWYPKDSGFELTAFSDADHAGCLDTRKSTSGGIQFLGDKLVSWMSKKQNCTAMSSAEAEYVALSASCAQVMWMRTQLQDYGFNYNKIPLYCDSQSAIAISCNPVQHSRTKHIHTRYHFIKEQVENGIIELYFVRTEYQLADMFTKALPEDRFKYLVRRIGMRCLTPAELEVLTNETA